MSNQSTKKPAFRLVPQPTFEFEVEIPVPGSDPQVLILIGRHKGKKAVMELQSNLLAEDGKTPPSDVEVLTEILAGWVNVEAEFNKEAIEQLLDNYPKANSIIYSAYALALMEGREKN